MLRNSMEDWSELEPGKPTGMAKHLQRRRLPGLAEVAPGDVIAPARVIQQTLEVAWASFPRLQGSRRRAAPQERSPGAAVQALRRLRRAP